MTTAETPRYLRTPISLVRLVTAAGLAAALVVAGCATAPAPAELDQ